MGSDPCSYANAESRTIVTSRKFTGSDPLTKCLSSSALKKLSSCSEIPGQDGSFLLTTFFF